MRNYRNFNKVYKKPRRMFERERLDRELKLVGAYGLRCKREIWRVNLTLSRMRRTARLLLTLPEAHPRRQLEGAALLRRCHDLGILEGGRDQLDYVLSLTARNILDRRLQTLVARCGLAASVHHARCLIRQRHIAVGGQIVTTPSFMVRRAQEFHLGIASASPLAPNAHRLGRVRRMKARAAKKRTGSE